MTHPNPSTALARVVIDQLAAHGVTSVHLSPGSRSGALAIAAAEHEEMTATVVIDERSAAFHALGVARASGAPAAVVCTSGTAAANFYPAVVEADMACVPLLVITADRPHELRGVGANQTIDQVEMFGPKVRVFEELAEPEPLSDANQAWRSAVDRAVAAATRPIPGPAHLNVAFREPTVPVTDDGRTAGHPYPFDTPRTVPPNDPRTERPLPALDVTAEDGIVIAGDGDYDRTALLSACEQLGWPVLGTALSGARGGGGVVTAYSRVLAGGVPRALRPRTVVAVGAIGPDTRLDQLIADAENRVRVDQWGRAIDPARNATHVVEGDPVALLEDVAGAADPGWSLSWQEADREARAHLDRMVASSEEVTGAAVAATLNHVAWGALVAASSLPIREVDTHLTRAGRVFANRGASGIDGFVSTAFGVASVIPKTLALAGDLSLLHDSNGFLHDGAIRLTLLVVDNHGGGLFDSLPQAAHAPNYERLFVTPPHRDIERLARFHDSSFDTVDDLRSLADVANRTLDSEGVHLIRVPVDREVDLRFRRQLLE